MLQRNMFLHYFRLKNLNISEMILNFQPVFAEEKNVDFKMEKLTIDKIDIFFDYFERIGFTDHIDFSMCYCLESHISEKEDETLDTKEKRQRKVIELINENRLSGYLIYANQNLIGWCNADAYRFKRGISNDRFSSKTCNGNLLY